MVRLPMHLRVLGSRMPLYVRTFCLAKTSTKTGQVLSLANFIRLAHSDPLKLRLQEVISACSLERDLAMLPQGEETEIGEKGINLSGAFSHLLLVSNQISTFH